MICSSRDGAVDAVIPSCGCSVWSCDWGNVLSTIPVLLKMLPRERPWDCWRIESGLTACAMPSLGTPRERAARSQGTTKPATDKIRPWRPAFLAKITNPRSHVQQAGGLAQGFTVREEKKIFLAIA